MDYFLSLLNFVLLISMLIAPQYACAEPDLILNKSFYFVRHAETDYNKNGYISGQSNDIPINEIGIEQANESARKFAKLAKVNVIIASPMLRAKQTAEIFAKYLNVPIIYNAGLKEANWGALEGRSVNNIQHAMALWVKGEDIEDAENIREFHHRIRTTMNEILSKYDNPLIVSHGGFFGNLTDIIDVGYMKTKNAIPYKFIPPKVSGGGWVVQNLM